MDQENLKYISSVQATKGGRNKHFQAVKRCLYNTAKYFQMKAASPAIRAIFPIYRQALPLWPLESI